MLHKHNDIKIEGCSNVDITKLKLLTYLAAFVLFLLIFSIFYIYIVYWSYVGVEPLSMLFRLGLVYVDVAILISLKNSVHVMESVKNRTENRL